MTLAQILRQARAQLIAALALDPAVASLEAHVLLGHVLQQSRTFLLANPERELNPAQAADFAALLQRRANGEPIAYLVESREFYGLNFKVTPDVLIPRPETELLIELALERIPATSPVQILDLGTGSGAIALALASALPNARVTAIDTSVTALDIARDNAERLSIKNVEFLEGDWLSPLAHGSRFDLILANPPYIAESDPHLQQGDVRFEPQSALRSGSDGLQDIRRIIAKARGFLTAQGWLLLEHGHEQAQACVKLLQESGYNLITTWADMAGQPRVTGGKNS